MTTQPVKAPTIPIPFQKLMKIVAIVDPNNMQTKELLEQLAAERYVVEVTDSFDRDVSEDASVGAYIALVDGERLEKARRLAEDVREAGFETPERVGFEPYLNQTGLDPASARWSVLAKAAQTRHLRGLDL